MASSDSSEMTPLERSYWEGHFDGYLDGYQAGWGECFDLALIGYVVLVLIGLWVALT